MPLTMLGKIVQDWYSYFNSLQLTILLTIALSYLALSSYMPSSIFKYEGETTLSNLKENLIRMQRGACLLFLFLLKIFKNDSDH